MLGLGLKDIRTEQLSAHILMLLEHGSEDSITGKLIRILCEGTLVECGVQGDIFWLHPSFCSWVEKNWIWNILENLEDSNIEIISSIGKLNVWKHDDVFIMEKISETKKFSKQELYIINNVRMHYKVCTLSDITDAAGLVISDNYKRRNSCSSKAYKWPRIPAPSRSMIQVWMKALQITFTCNENNIKQDYITNKWKSESEKFIEWWISKDNEYLYENNNEVTRIWRSETGRTRQTIYCCTERVCDKLPLDTVTITVRRIENGVLIESIAIMERNIIEEPKKKGLG